MRPHWEEVMLKFVRTLAIICAAVTSAQTASAQSSAYPDKPIHFIVAFVPGGATDTFARQISNDL
jgi:tripartite-type tricarboxylate transporter receptor subunit TctC